MSTFPYLARTTLKYKSPHATDLSFAKDETIRVTGPSDDDEDWLVGENLDGSKSGGFPKDFIVPIESEEPEAEPAPTSASAPAEPDLPPMPKEAPAPPSPVMEPAKLPPSAAASPAPAVAPSAPISPAVIPAAVAPLAAAPPPAQNDDGSEPAKQSMKERLAFFAAAQNKVAPPPPVKPKPAAGGLTWSQRQKLRQEQEAKEADVGGAPAPAAAAPAAITAPAPAAAPPAPAPASSVEEEAKAAGLSAADAQSSIGKGGSLKERMAALRGAGAFGAPEAKVAPSPPAKPSGKVWSRPAAPEPQPGEKEEEAPAPKDGEEAKEEGGEEETEEEQEKARRAAIASRMAKLGARGPMGMAAPLKAARKPTSEAISPSVEKSEPVVESESPIVEKEPELTISPPASVTMPAIPRRTAGPRRTARPAAKVDEPAKADEADSKEKVHPDGTISPPPAVMVANEEEPLPKSEEQLAEEKQHVDAGKGPTGLQGAQAAGIALALEGEADEEEAGESQARQVPQMVPVHPPAASGPSTDDEEAAPAVPSRQPISPSQAMLGLPRDEIEMKHEHDAAAQREEEDEDEDDAPAPPPRILAERPTGPRPLPSVPVAQVPVPPAESSDNEEEEDEEEDAPPPPPARQPSMPLPPRTVPPPVEDSDEEQADEEEEEAPPPPPPVRRPTLPPPAPPAPAEDDSEGEADIPPPPPPVRKPTLPPPPAPAAASDDEGDDEPAPPPPRRQPSVPGIQIPTAGAAAPRSPFTTSPVVSTSPGRSKSPIEATPTSAEPEVTEEDEEAARRKGIAARMAKLGGIKFGVPPPVPKIKRSATNDEPSSPAVSQPPPETPTGDPVSPSKATRVAPPVAEERDETEETAEEESERRRKTLARLRAGGSLGMGMFGQGHSTQKVEEEEVPQVVEEEVEAPVSPVTARPPVPANRPLPSAPAPPPPAEEEEEEEEDVPPPPQTSRPPVPANRPLPTPAVEAEAEDEEEEEEAPPPPPPARPARTSSEAPLSPVRSNSVRTADAPALGAQTDEPAEIPRSPERPSRPPPIQTVSQTPPPQPQSSASPTARRSMSIASRQSFQSAHAPPSPSLARQESGRVSAVEGPRSSIAGGRPGFNELQAASQDAGARVLRAAQGLFSQGKRAYIGDGTSAGFLMVIFEQAQLARPEQSWGQVVYEQESASVLRRSDEPRPGDVIALFDAKFKGRKGLSSYSQHVGSVEEPLVGVVGSIDQKKKLKVLQVERGVLDEVSYRLDDLKSGRVVVYRPGV